MLTLEGIKMSELYIRILEMVLWNGKRVQTRGMDVIEIEDFSFVLEDPLSPFVLQKARGLNLPYAVLEPFLLARPQTYATKEACCFYVGKFLNEFVVNPETKLMDGFYGDRINRLGKNQLLDIYNLLKKDPNTRRAILTIHSSAEELQRPTSNDIPCTLDLQFIVRDRKLDLIVNMRGNDAMLGTPQNVPMWTFFQRMMAKWLELGIGRYHHRVGSMHIYHRDMQKTEQIIATRNVMGKYENFNEKSLYEWAIGDPVASLIECEKFALVEMIYRNYEMDMSKELSTVNQILMQNLMFPYIRTKKELLNNVS